MITLAFCTNHPTAVGLVDRALRSEHPGYIIQTRPVDEFILDIMGNIGVDVKPLYDYLTGELPEDLESLRVSTWWLDAMMQISADILLIPDIKYIPELNHLHKQGAFVLADRSFNADRIGDFIIKENFDYSDAMSLVKEVVDALVEAL